jgi:Arc/MetJ-type ribon-helix-helix transcriptional regulator/predicted RNA-binding Zn-ribbon protein involved in translation (DUF1610 family)
MSKITFRADDDLIERLEEFDASKSEVMREALREFLDERGDARVGTTESTAQTGPSDDSLDDLIAERVDELVADRLDRAFTRRRPQDVNVNISLSGDSVETSGDAANASHDASDNASHEGDSRKTPSRTDENADANDANVSKTCGQCGEELSAQHVYCPNCGEKSARRVFCDCGDELRSDWAFCPSCGRRTPAADVLDNP